MDLCIIDTDHNYWTLAKELTAIAPKITQGGMIAFHDVDEFYHNTGLAMSYWNDEPYPKDEILECAKFGGVGDALLNFLVKNNSEWKLLHWTKESYGAALIEKKTVKEAMVVMPGKNPIFAKPSRGGGVNVDCFLKRYTGVLLNDENDALFQTFKVLVGGTTSVRIMKLLNFAVSQIGHDECYVETGVYTGGTLISANWMNGRTCIGIDPYEGMVECKDFSAVRDQARININGMALGSKLIEKDFKKIGKDEIGMPIAVSFIDAMHNFDGVYENLVWLDPLLADHAIIIFDDINFLGVSQAISQVVVGTSKYL